MKVKKFIPIREEIQEQEVIQGKVKGIQPYGVFIEIAGGVVGLLHIEDISVARMRDPSERFKIGQEVEVMVKSINREENKLFFTYKELLGSWEDNVKEFEEGTTVRGIVKEKEKSQNGVFIELTPNLVGLAEYEEELEYGQNVDVYIKKIIPDKKKIKLIIC